MEVSDTDISNKKAISSLYKKQNHANGGHLNMFYQFR